MVNRRYPIGPQLVQDGVHFRVWAPDCTCVTVVMKGQSDHDLLPEDNGYFADLVNGVTSGALYRFRLDHDTLAPDPVSSFQPDGPHGPSQVIDPQKFQWTDEDWRGPTLLGTVVYELHIGTFTPEGTWKAAERELPELASLGVNCLEVMPVADFSGRFGWGYDGVNLFAPTRLYGSPDDFRAFVNAAHRLGIAVVLDVVYNHLGPDGNYLGKFASGYFTDRYKTDWGLAINFDGTDSAPVRQYFLTNAEYWIRDFHLDGLRLDATQNIYDSAPHDKHILTQIAERSRAAARNRSVILIAENEPQHPQLCRPVDAGGNGLDALWNDDYHHSAMVALTGRREAYYTDYLGSPQEFVSAAKYGYLYQGQWYSWQEGRRGRPGCDLPHAAFVNFLQNHDQIANSGRGLRAHQQSTPARYRALTALTLLMPGTPMLFQGQEFAASNPFLYFADHPPELAKLVQAGRTEFLSQFPSLADRRMIPELARPHDLQTFQRCKLDFSQRISHAAEYQLTRDLLQLRRTKPGFQPLSARGIDGAVIAPHAFVLRYFFENRQDRLLVVNFGPDLDLSVIPEPLLAPPEEMRWRVALSTEEPKYGGNGVRSPDRDDGGWFIPADVAMVLEGTTDRPEQSQSTAHDHDD